MLPLSSPSASPDRNAFTRTDALASARAVALERSAAKATERIGQNAAPAAPARQETYSSVMTGLSTVSMASGSMTSLPAALGRMSNIALAANSGVLSDADRATLQAEYSQLSRQVSSSIGSVSAGSESQSSSKKRDEDSSRREAAGQDLSANMLDAGDTPRHDPVQQELRSVAASGSVSSSSTPARQGHATVHAVHASVSSSQPVLAADSQATRHVDVAQFQQHFTQQHSRVSLVA